MKKIIAFTLALCLCLSCGVTALADDSNRQTELKVEIAESYTVVIPATLEIPFNSTSTNLPIEVTSLRLLPTGTIENTVRAVWVELDQPSFRLVNDKDSNSTILYGIGGGEGTYGRVLKFTEKGTKNYTVTIAQSDWNNAAAGTYTDTVTFDVSITNISKPSN